eukprot:857240-Amphidinium_carterae.1
MFAALRQQAKIFGGSICGALPLAASHYASAHRSLSFSARGEFANRIACGHSRWKTIMYTNHQKNPVHGRHPAPAAHGL